MRYLTFKEELKKFPIFTLQDIRKISPDFQLRRLVEWREKGYIQNIRQGIYCFLDHELGESFLFFAANRIYKHSYISLESALSYYNLIPEGVFTLTSVGTQKTASFETGIGNYSYRQIRPELFFGYQLIRSNHLTFKIAEPEKAILDYFYLNKPKDFLEIEAIRLDGEAVREIIARKKFEACLNAFDSAVLNKRITMLKEYLYAEP